MPSRSSAGPVLVPSSSAESDESFVSSTLAESDELFVPSSSNFYSDLILTSSKIKPVGKKLTIIHLIPLACLSSMST